MIIQINLSLTSKNIRGGKMILSNEQLAAVRHMYGSALCIAGPGSGKTAVIVNRVDNLIKKGVKPEEILVVTFTKAAANSMEKRFFNMTGITGVVFSTIHSVCYRIIRQDLDNNITLIPENIKRNILLKLYSDHKNDNTVPNMKRYHDISMEISRFKSCLEEISDSGNDHHKFLKEYDTHFISKDLFEKIYYAYHDYLKKYKYYDFDDMTYLADVVLKKKASNGRKKTLFSFLMIDEFQDTSFPQLKVLTNIVSGNNVFAVGDDDQSIYSFRGASPSILKRFHLLYPDNKIYYLKNNYRCNETITSASNNVIKENKDRFQKTIISKYVSDNQGLFIKEYRTQYKEFNATGSFLLSEKYDKTKSFAILTRTNYESEIVCCYLKRMGIKFNSALKDNDPFDDPSVQMILSFMRFSLKKPDLSDYINVFRASAGLIPGHVVSSCYTGEYYSSLNNLYKYAGTDKLISDHLKKLEDKMELLSDMSPSMQVRFIRNACNIDDYFRQRTVKDSGEYGVFDERMEAFYQFSNGFSTAESLLEFKRCFREKEEILQQYSGNKSNINVMTLHASKGLEFDYVWIMNLNDGIIPYKKAVEKGMIEEERRLLYVGMTRARDYLILSHHRSFGSKQIPKSVFLKELASFY